MPVLFSDFLSPIEFLSEVRQIHLHKRRCSMCVRNAAPAEAVPLNGSATLIDQLIVLSGARPIDRIAVAGHKTLDVFLGLCRRGFLNATCRTAAEGPHTWENSADSLWIVDTENAAELRTLIARCTRDLRKDGTLLVSVSSPTANESVVLLGSVLVRCGFTPVRKLISSERILLFCERRVNVAGALSA
jgi:hypothetical protein